MKIIVDDLRGPEIASLIGEHLHNMTLHSPAESIHALDLESLRKPDITFWSAWDGHALMGCGAIKQLSMNHGEVKSMKTSPDHVRKGVARKLLQHILEESKKRGYTRVSLETGSMDAFLPARRLYESFGFKYCGPFADYKEDTNSVFMTKVL
ncbi:GNAT family N-acetyltransferase [Radiobacillus deserti]|uniref:GNAT family N-acetyltransferase n=1 Tax=Radiobacillus deserti TaxID=2594883 RepID=A0A516KI76_9BACI|nr:GNAT family N-acetyltransferase [Radiobacillus deserti]QDP41066.1 GNAT family N-acetyltransferase [Radiobacillus deserti]